ncbi:hypothetical protein OGAPHI_005335 [Ogataea philodendri]|uniref:THUMP domain-containing protein n=1 Tax=Ogataea philodendri TaxID=1378263 RepID=A0A9P8P122_9ASCO|nr:uncharacterized protein OGAPHI_005335 [Ogataea philodendri]KAH3663345.1 hypothetical protein OGAPHI_005335 [Ogataea philodendri]
MGKRAHSGGGQAKRFKTGVLVEPGQVGIYASCNRHKEGAGAKELKQLLNDRWREYFPVDQQEATDSADEDHKEESIEDSIKRELAELNKTNQDAKMKEFVKEMNINCDSLIFIKTRKPIVPSLFVARVCDELYESKAKNTRFLQKLTPIDYSCNATETEFVKMAEKAFAGHFDNGESYSINLIKRNFSIIDREKFNELIAQQLPDHRLNYRTPDKMINIFCFKNNIGISVVDFASYNSRSKYNLQQLFDKANGLDQDTPAPDK